MRKLKMNRVVLLLLLMAGMAACSSDSDMENPFTGRWKLVCKKFVNMADTTMSAPESGDVIYVFAPVGRYKIMRNGEEAGSSLYFFNETHLTLFGIAEPNFYTKYSYTLSKDGKTLQLLVAEDYHPGIMFVWPGFNFYEFRKE